MMEPFSDSDPDLPTWFTIRLGLLEFPFGPVELVVLLGLSGFFWYLL